ncbi:hypothetical protein P3W45_001800, partial [Vairimorpha bombi]
MNRTDEYMKYINIPNQEPLTSNKVLFYDDIYYDIQKLNKSITPTLSYKNILILEKSISKISENVQQTLSVISIEGTRDEVVHFEGVKKIIQSLILSTRLRLEKLKIKKGSLSMDLEPERPKSYKVSPEIHHMEQETMEIMGNSVVERYRVTKQRLLEIESIQENISEQLNIQDERIDDVISKVGDIYESVRSSKDTVEKVTEAGSFFRRFFIILIELQKSRILSFLKSHTHPWKVLILDTHTQSIISPLLKIKELRDCGITSYFLISNTRYPISNTPAIYFVSDVDEISKDVLDNLYSDYHIHSSKLAVTLSRKGLGLKVSQITDQYVDFISLQDDFFTFNMIDSYIKKEDISGWRQIVTSLVSICVTLGGIPALCSTDEMTHDICKMVEEKT